MIHVDSEKINEGLEEKPVIFCTSSAAQVKNCSYEGQIEAADDEEVDWVAGVKLAVARREHHGDELDVGQETSDSVSLSFRLGKADNYVLKVEMETSQESEEDNDISESGREIDSWNGHLPSEKII